jgi:3-isopropylmalate/(R)-2-methylmalate dehydratase large subunit
MAGKTLYDKIWDAHIVASSPGHGQAGEAILYIDLHLIHEVTTPQAFAGLRAAGRKVRRPDRTLAVADHNIPTEGQAWASTRWPTEARLQLQTLARNVAEATASSSSPWAISATASSTWSGPSRAAPSPA